MSFAVGFLAVIVTCLPSSSRASSGSENFDSQRQNGGVIASPDYPYSYREVAPKEKNYRFMGYGRELVQIVFDGFHMPKLNPNESCGRRNAYLSYRREDRVVYLCGFERPLPILSEALPFTLEYRVPREFNEVSEEPRGFNATFKFVSNYGIETGIQTVRDTCEFIFNSADAKNGTFYSPNFPGYYLRNMECRYEFRGDEKYLRFNFTEFNLLGPSRVCSMGGDVLKMMETVDEDRTYFYDRLCYQLESFNLAVNSSTFYVTFASYNNYPPESNFTEVPFVGFHAYYEFTNDTSSSPRVFQLPESSLHFLFPLLCLMTNSWLSRRFA